MTDERDFWRSDRIYATGYDTAVERPLLARLFGTVIWGTDTRLLYDALGSLADLPDGTSVLDIPCGGGLAFRGLPADHRLTYIAADISPYMLQRAKARAAAEGVANIAFTEADALHLHFDDASFDHVISFNGLHCLPEQAPAVAEMARVLRPGGTLRGTTVVRGAGIRQDAAIAVLRRFSAFGETTTENGLATMLADAGFDDIELSRSGALAHFRARKPRA